MKTNAIIRIVLYALALVILLSILLAFLCFDTYIIDGKVKLGNQDLVQEPVGLISADSVTDAIRNLEIEWAAGSITILKDKNITDIQITETSTNESKHQMVLKQSGQTLKIQYSEESIALRSFGFNEAVSKDLTITVPANWICNALEIDAAAADVEICDLQIGELDFDGASGKLTLDNCIIDELDIDTASGDIEFSGTLQTLDFDAASAKFYGEFLQNPRRLSLDAMSGDLEIVLPEKCGISLDMDTMSGSFDTDFDFGMHNNTYICGDGACKINVSAMSGDVNILKGITAAHSQDIYDCVDPECTEVSHNHSSICTIENCTDEKHDHKTHH